LEIYGKGKQLMSVAKCIGWWEQNGLGRQAMEGLTIEFSEGSIRGGGVDVVGQFTISGAMELGGGVRIVKQYTGRHHVVYIGNYDGEGTLSGTWLIDRLAGLWSIKLLHASSGDIEFEEVSPWKD